MAVFCSIVNIPAHIIIVELVIIMLVRTHFKTTFIFYQKLFTINMKSVHVVLVTIFIHKIHYNRQIKLIFKMYSYCNDPLN